MDIKNSDIAIFILKILGLRIKNRRIKMNIKQSDMEKLCGLSVSTIIRMENGNDTKLSNLIKVLKALGLTENLNDLIPDDTLDYKRIFKMQKQRKRVRPKKAKPTVKEWVWNEDKMKKH